jgi:hypothetical protein
MPANDGWIYRDGTKKAGSGTARRLTATKLMQDRPALAGVETFYLV